MIAAITSPAPDNRVPAPRLTRLDVQGFKSFAAKTAIVFEPGITAIVGPNGSGKSNVADAVRWVLGEQGQGTLRARRGEDVIFAGGQGRAPAGLAEATLTFDNADGWLPIDFAEVAVTRRIFRGGDSQFLINGRRVRLKDVAQLTASLGQSHVVVGQGLVDAALSQKAEDRRALFEHAADLTGIRLKVVEAERGLTETEANRERLHDLLSELEPRLRRMERAAKQADEWRTLRDQLSALLLAHFHQRLSTAAAQTMAAAAELARHAALLSPARAAVNAATGATDLARHKEATARASLVAHDAATSDATNALRAAQHDLALTDERVGALARRAEDLRDTRQSLLDRAREIAANRESLAVTIAGLTTEMDVRDAAVVDLRQCAETRQHELTANADGYQQLTGRQRVAEQTIAAAERTHALLAQREIALGASQARVQAETAAQTQRLAALDNDLDLAEQTIASATTEGDALALQLAALSHQIEQTNQTVVAAATAIRSDEGELTRALARHEALSKLRQSGAGLHAGVRAVLQAASEQRLTGVRGAVAELIAAPAGLETALEIALGGHLQDVVVERWADAEAAIALLKRTQAGRATFQPLDTVRPSRSPDARLASMLTEAGVRGIAAALVEFSPDLRPVVDALLGRTIVVTDLSVARAMVPRLPLGWNAVTLAGEIARAGGSVTGGAAARESGLLIRERELRELPAAIEALRRSRQSGQVTHAHAAAEQRALDLRSRDLQARVATLRAAIREETRQAERLRHWRDELTREHVATRTRTTETAQEGVEVAALLVAATDQLRLARAALVEASAEQAEVEIAWQAAAAATEAARQHLQAAEQQRIAHRERLRGERQRHQELASQRAALDAELEQRAHRLANLDREQQQGAARRVELEHVAAMRHAALTALRAEREPIVAAVDQAAAAWLTADRQAAAAQTALLTQEREHNAVSLAHARAVDHRDAIRTQAEQELEPEGLTSLAAQGPATDRFGEDHTARESEIGRVRDRLRRIGYIGDDVVAEYTREAEHHRFVRAQLDDVAGAAAALRGLLGELRETMRRRFEATFSRVAVEFSANFTELFGGGTAELVLAAGAPEAAEASAGGVDIVAQPPGKRLQNLALLSGGERALTAVALLFAILRVNPAPFCVLDEVDAALDEANVVRFRDQLRRLAARTQVIIVTHNRGTLEIANTLYGVSMGADGVSRTLSLRLDEAPLPD